VILKTLTDHLQLSRDYREVFGTEHGKRVLNHILRVSGATSMRFTTEAERLIWNEAQRHLALSIFRRVHTSLDKLPDYIQEEIRRTEEEKKEKT